MTEWSAAFEEAGGRAAQTKNEYRSVASHAWLSPLTAGLERLSRRWPTLVVSRLRIRSVKCVVSVSDDVVSA